jgi:hypothetical protein
MVLKVKALEVQPSNRCDATSSDDPALKQIVRFPADIPAAGVACNPAPSAKRTSPGVIHGVNEISCLTAFAVRSA